MNLESIWPMEKLINKEHTVEYFIKHLNGAESVIFTSYSCISSCTKMTCSKAKFAPNSHV